MRDVCKNIQTYLTKGHRPRKNTNMQCQQPWNWKITGKTATHNTTKLKHLKVVQELSDLGIQWEEDKDVSIQSKIFAKTERNNVRSSLRRKTMQNDVI